MTLEAAAEDPVRVEGPAPFSYTEEEKELIRSVRRQCDAKAAAELLLGEKKRVRPKTIRGRACLFVGKETTTFYTGYTWAGAVARLIYLLRTESPEAVPLLKEIEAATPAIGGATL